MLKGPGNRPFLFLASNSSKMRAPQPLKKTMRLILAPMEGIADQACATS